MKRSLPFNADWRFHRGDIDTPKVMEKIATYLEAKTESKRCGPAAKDYQDTRSNGRNHLLNHEGWRNVCAPHDYVIEGTPHPDANEALGYLDYPNAWYRKRFFLDKEEEGKRICLYFEAVAIHCRVYVNGVYLLSHTSGYSPFEVDISDVALYGEENTVAVYIDNSEHEGWWYEGAGLTRNVWLEISEDVSVERDGVFVHPQKEETDWLVPVEIEVRSDRFEDVCVRAECRIVGPDGQETELPPENALLPARKKTTLHLSGRIASPALWNTREPKLYTLRTVLYANDAPVEEREDRFGFRTIRFDADEGFFLNGERVEIKGVCNHTDNGLTGRAVPERLQKKRLEMMKEMGANGYRCAHYPHPAYTMDLLDEMGFLVMAETRWFSTAPESMAQLETLVRRDRNHPCVILWSAGNEEPMHVTDQGRRIARAMMERIRELDGSRPVTTAVSDKPANSTVSDIVDVMGVNYNLSHFDLLHEKNPSVPLLSSENTALSGTRGWYYPDSPERGYMSAYDENKENPSRAETWKFISQRKWIAGGYQWTGMEHRGSKVWPLLSSQTGAVDIFMQRKEAFYVNQALWLEEPVIHLIPHWNWKGLEGEEVRVAAYTNCECAELFLNGRSLGKIGLQRFEHAEWRVPYEPGELRVKGWRGETCCEDVQVTTGAATRLRLRQETPSPVAGLRDVALFTCECLDAEGRVVPDAAPIVRFSANGLGSVIGTGSDVCDPVPPASPIRKMRAGAISVLVRVGNTPGALKLYAEADGLGRAVITVPVGAGPEKK